MYHCARKERHRTDATVTRWTTRQTRMNKSLNSMPQLLARLSRSRANSYLGTTADVVISLVLLGAGLWRNDLRLVTTLLIVLCGFAIFSLIEYCVHRFLFHGPVSLFEQGHRRHHEEPLGYDALPFFLPPLVMLALAGLLARAMPGTAALLLSGGIAGGYAAYGLSHMLIHATRFRHPLARRWAAAHHVHHCHPERNFGVTSPLWDLLLRTQYVSAGKSPQRRAN